jgi:hypothetical protein
MFKRRRQKSVTVTVLELCGDGYCEVVGESHYQEALRQTAAISTPGEHGRRSFTAVLAAEPSNPYDPNAIAVFSPRGKIGYLSRDCALDYAEVFAEIKRRGYQGGGCQAYLIGGEPGKPSYGVTLRLADPPACLEYFDAD